MTSKLRQAATQVRKSLGAHAIYCPLLGVKVKNCKITTCEFYKTCSGSTEVKTKSNIQDL